MTVVVESREDFTLENFRRVALDWGERQYWGAGAGGDGRREDVVHGPPRLGSHRLHLRDDDQGRDRGRARARSDEQREYARAAPPAAESRPGFGGGGELEEHVVRGIVFARLANFVEGQCEGAPCDRGADRSASRRTAAGRPAWRRGRPGRGAAPAPRARQPRGRRRGGRAHGALERLSLRGGARGRRRPRGPSPPANGRACLRALGRGFPRAGRSLRRGARSPLGRRARDRCPPRTGRVPSLVRKAPGASATRRRSATASSHASWGRRTERSPQSSTPLGSPSAP